MGSNEGHQSASFVIRLWLESDEPPTPPDWRWRVVHVQSGAERYGDRWADLLAFIAARAGAALNLRG
ncbi:MAG: hypothetical protein KGJ86_12315 [Chloroflexota bacterium]|nr:hypothetical protein [Chloroflexota bacterium]